MHVLIDFADKTSMKALCFTSVQSYNSRFHVAHPQVVFAVIGVIDVDSVESVYTPLLIQAYFIDKFMHLLSGIARYGIKDNNE